MIVHCISVVPICRKYRDQPQGFLVGIFSAGVDGLDPGCWALLSVLPSVFGDDLRCEVEARGYVNDDRGPFIAEIEHGDEMDARAFRLSCKSQGVKCCLPDPTPLADPAATEGAPA